MSQDSSKNEDSADRIAFLFLIGALALALLAGLWGLIQVAFL
jgi:hypothetical protein